MKKINKKSINYGLKILIILAFISIFAPFNRVFAQSGEGGSNYTFGTAYSGYSNYNGNSYYNSTPYQPPIYTPASTTTTTPIVYSNETNPNATSAATVPARTVARARTSNSTNSTVASSNNSNSANGLAASVVYGSNSFLPSGLIQWILFGIFILLLIILVRRIFGGREKYLATPLKHE
jgi:hypothetical protein